MRKIYRIFLLLTLLILAGRSNGQEFASQEPDPAPIPQPQPLTPISPRSLWVGLRGSANFVKYTTGEISVLSAEPGCYTVKNGSGIAPSFGMTAMLPVGNENAHYISLDILYDSKSAGFFSQNQNRSNIPTKLNGQVVQGGISTAMKASLRYLVLAAGYKYNFMNAPLPAGPTIGIALEAGYAIRNVFDETVTVSASSQTRSEQASAEIDGVNKIRFGIRGELGYDIPFGNVYRNAFVLSPHIGYDFPFTEVDNSRSWAAASWYAGIGVHYSIEIGYF